MSSDPIYVGIDVSKDTLDLARSDSKKVVQFDNNDQGIAKLVESLRPADTKLIVIESTGGLERPLIGALLDADLPAALVHPGRVRSLAHAMHIHAKTDRIDARLLMLFGHKAEPRLTEKLGKNREELADLVACRRQLTATRVQQQNRRRTTFSPSARASIDAVLQTLDKQLNKLEQQIRQLIDSDDQFRDLEKILRTVPGVGPGLAAELIAEMPELGRTDRQAIAAIAGVAPYDKSSGNTKGQMHIKGGRTSVRNVGYMAALAAMRFNPVIKIFADRLIQKGKSKKVVIIACLRKLLTLLNAMVRQNLTWNQLDIVKKLNPNP